MIDWKMMKELFTQQPPSLITVSPKEWSELAHLGEIVMTPGENDTAKGTLWGIEILVSGDLKPGIMTAVFPEKQ